MSNEPERSLHLHNHIGSEQVPLPPSLSDLTVSYQPARERALSSAPSRLYASSRDDVIVLDGAHGQSLGPRDMEPLASLRPRRQAMTVHAAPSSKTLHQNNDHNNVTSNVLQPSTSRKDRKHSEKRGKNRVKSTAETKTSGNSGSISIVHNPPITQTLRKGSPGKPRQDVAGEFVRLNEHLRELQLEVATLRRQLREIDEDSSIILRYSRRGVLCSNLGLGLWLFSSTLTTTFREGARSKGLPGARKRNISALFLTGAWHAVVRSALFFLAAGVGSRQSWRRNLAFTISVCYSGWLALRSDIIPLRGLYLNIFLNFVSIIARYYYLHGLLVFKDFRFL